MYRKRDEPVHRSVVEELPRQIGHAWIAEAQANPQSGVLTADLVDAAPEAGFDVGAEHRIEERRAERLRGVHLLRFNAPRRAPRPAEPQEIVLELVFREGQLELDGRLAGR
jgi:hypothetical protein